MPLQDSRVQRAMEAIGPDAPDDYVLAPGSHAAGYASAAPELAFLLRSSEVQVAAELYEELDRMAVEAQRRFATTAERARSAVFWVGILGALLLVSVNLSTLLGEYLVPVVALVTTGGVVAGNLAAMWLHSIRNGALFERWKARRAEAELARLRYFEIVTRERELSEPLLQLEYFRRYQLDVQRAYYRKRGRDHEREAVRALQLGSLAMAAGGIATGVAGALAVSLGPAWGSLAILALVAQAVGVRAGNREATAQNRRNAERYHRTRTVLRELYGRLDAVRAAVAAGEPAAMRELVAAVHEQLALEHREWVAEMEAAGEAIHRLEELLERHRESPGEAPAEAGRFFGVGGAVLPPVRLPTGARAAGASRHPPGEEPGEG